MVEYYPDEMDRDEFNAHVGCAIVVISALIVSVLILLIMLVRS